MSRNPLSYMGIRPKKTAKVTVASEDPSTDWLNHDLGDVVVNEDTKTAYMLTSKENSISTWYPISGNGGTDFQDSVIKQCAVGAATETEGNRYLSTATGGAWTINYIYEWSSGSWEGTAPASGMMTYDENTTTILVYTGAAWQNASATIGSASETAEGVIELATTTEVVAGIDTTRAVTTAGLIAKLGTQTDHGVLLGSGTTAAVTATAAGTSGQPLLSSGAGADPNWGTLSVEYGGTEATSLTDHGVLVGSGVTAITALTVGTDGQVLVGDTSADPVFATISSTDGSVTTALGAGTLALTVTQAAEAQLGGGEVATDAECVTGSDDTKLVSAKKMATYCGTLPIGVDSNETTKGVVEIATQAEVATGTIDSPYAVTPLKLKTHLASPNPIGSVAPSTGAFTTLASAGTTSLLGGQVDIATDNAANAVNIGLGSVARAIAIGSSAASHTITIGSDTGACSLDLVVGTGNFTLDGAATSDFTVGASSTTGAITVGGTAQTGTITIGSSSGTNIVEIATGTGKATVNIADGLLGSIVSVANSANSVAQTINLAGGASAANSTVNILSGNASAGTQTFNVMTGTRAGAVNISTGAAAHVTTIGNSNGAAQVDILVGTGNFSVEGANTSTYGISTSGADSGTITIGGGTGVQQIDFATGGTGVKTVNLATGAIGNIVTIGTVSAAASLDLKCGTGNFTLEGATGSTYTISGTGVNTGTVTIAGGTGARTVNLGIGGTGAKTINVGTGASADVITIGTTDGAGSLDLKCGTNNFTLEGATGSTYTISGTGVNTGTCTFGGGTGARAINLGIGGTGVKTIGIGTGASADIITIGTTDGAGSLALVCGTGNFTLEGDVATTYGISATGANTGTISIGTGTGAQILNLMTGGTGVKTVNIATGAIGNLVTIGTVTAAASLDLKCGTGNFTLEGNVASTYSISATGANVGTITIGAGTGAQTLNLMTGGTGVKTVNIATGAIGNLVTIGTVTAAASLDLKCGTGNFTLEGDVASTYEISSTGANTGTCKFASGTGARTVEIAGGGTGIKTINIGTGATADVITVGTTDGAGTTDLISGSGGVTINGGGDGLVDVVPSTDSQATPTAATTQNSNVLVATFTGYTTAAAGTQSFTITNSLISTSSGILTGIHNAGAADAQMVIKRITPAAGSCVVLTQNDGAAALDGDVVISLWVLS